MSINRVVLVGRLTKDPELRYTPSGVATCSFTLAVNRNFKNQSGDYEADFVQIVAWRQLAELCANYLKKGSQTGLEGRIQTRSYDNKEGKRVYVTEVVADNIQFLDNKKEGNTQSASSSYPSSSDPFASESRTINISDDDLPF